ncbi:nitrite reductase small subunit NirD [Guptibacillus hwajinpoensis]|uniref:nitrite reductase small subunit NirD n=1 Tax=Guptibacillus hwajinpoensis TaxID=208199 RepID=UPI003735A3AB
MPVQASKVNIGRIEDFPPQSGKTVEVLKWSIAVFHLSNGSMQAVENKCPHKGGPLAEGIICGDHVYCPLHDWKISTTDGKVQEPDTGCVQTFPVDVEDGYVYLTIE